MLYYSRNDVQHIQRKVITAEDVRYPKPQSKFMERKLFIERRKTLWISLYYLQEESLILSTDRDHSDLVPYSSGKTLYPGIWLWDKQTIRKTRRIAQGNLSSRLYDITLSYFMLNTRRISGWMNKKLKYLVLCDLRQHLRMSSADFSSKPVQWVSFPSGIVKISK